MVSPFKAAAKNTFFLSKTPVFFDTPVASGRRIVCSFSYIQQIGRKAAVDVWFPDDLRQRVAKRVLEGDVSVLDEFGVEWAAVRQFELMQESDNLAIRSLEFMNMRKAFGRYLMRMKGGGYRVTIITMGRYETPQDYDELAILDKRLQDEITRLVHMIYMDEQSAAWTEIRQTDLNEERWSCAEALPHVVMSIGSVALFFHKKGLIARRQKLAERFLRIVEALPQNHIVHDVATGLALPEMITRQNWICVPEVELRISSFQHAIKTVFESFDHVSLGQLHERAGAGMEPAHQAHMRGYGQRDNAHERKSARIAWEHLNAA